MIEYKKGNILHDGSEAIVNTINTVGVMGKGIALAFKKAYPDNFEAYRKAHDEGKLQTGKMLVFETDAMFPKFIINFPTKAHWRFPSKLEYITEGLKDLVNVIKEKQIKSIAIPPLGCGNGKLDWQVVKPIMEAALKEIGPTTKITFYEPGFQVEEKPIANAAAKLTDARAMLLHLVNEYSKSDYAVNLLVIQKLAYFLQRSGINLRLNYEKGWFGPYARELSYVLDVLNGTYIHFIPKSNKPETLVKLDTANWQNVETYIQENLSEEQKSKLEDVVGIIEGFESPFGLELLSTVDFIKLNCSECSPSDIRERIQNWTHRKKELMPLYQIEVAYQHLQKVIIYQEAL